MTETARTKATLSEFFAIPDDRRFHELIGAYREVERSVALPRIDLVDLARIIAATDDSEQTDAVRATAGQLDGRHVPICPDDHIVGLRVCNRQYLGRCVAGHCLPRRPDRP